MKSYFEIFQDFPKEGISFVDINSVLLDPIKRDDVKKLILFSITKNLYPTKFNKVVGVESRGFLFLNSIADEFNCGVVLARKSGKLPGEVETAVYGTEYSKDSLEMQKHSIQPGDKVLIHDDILATGGTAQAVKQIVESLGGIVVGFSFIGEIDGLQGRDLLGDVPISCPIKF